MPYIKTIYFTSIFLSILFSFISCQSPNEKEIIIGVSQCSEDIWRTTQNQEMLREAALYPNVAVEIKTVKDDSQQQIRDIEKFIEQDVDVLIISPNEAEKLTPVVEKAYQKGIPVILIERKVNTDKYTSFVGADNYDVGKNAGAYIADLLNGKGNIVEIRGSKGATSDTERHKGFIEEIQKYPELKIIEEHVTDWHQEDAEEIMQEIMSRNHEPIDVVFAMNDRMAYGVYNILSKYSGRRPYIVGIDALPGKGNGISQVVDRSLEASIIYPTGGDRIIDIAMNILNKHAIPKENLLRTAVVDKNNARVISMQYDQILQHEKKIEKMNLLLDQSLQKYSNQRNLFTASIVILILLCLFLFMSYMAYRSKSKSNRKLAHQNEEIRKQSEQLAEQKEQLIRLSKELEEATQAKLVFFTNISHELKTPLTLILGPVETLLSNETLTDEQQQLLSLIKSNSQRLLKLISQIIEFRRYENGKLQAYFTYSDLRYYLQEILVPFDDFAKRKQISFKMESCQDSILMWFDREKIEQIVYNLISNAFKYTSRGGEIKVSLDNIVKDSEDYAQLTIYNNGKVIPQDAIKNIFDRFYKVDPHEAGSGIGLALVSALVEVHNGSVKVESSEERGTVFTVILPFKQNRADNISNAEIIPYQQNDTIVLPIEEDDNELEKLLSDNSYSDNKPSILIIEDNTEVRDYIHLILKEYYTIIEASNGKMGIEKAVKYIPDIIISDIMMPEKDGFEVCSLLKENISTSHIPIILLTACALDEQRAMGFESGADAYIPKPFNSEILKIRIRKLIENRKKIKEAFGNNLINDTKKDSLSDTEQEFIDKFRKYIEDNISDTDMNVDEIGRNMGLSRIQLYRKIKSLTNYAPNELIRIIRLKKASKIMLSSNKTIAEIAYETGFSSPSYFTKCFKEYYNESPSDYVKRSKLKS